MQDHELLEVKGLDPRQIARAALDNHVMVYELTPLQASLEEAYMELTKDEVEYHSLITTGARSRPSRRQLSHELNNL